MRKFVGVPILCLVAGGCAHSVAVSPQVAPAEFDEALSPAAFANPSARTAQESTARDLIEKLSRHDYPSAVANFDDKMKASLPADKLEKAWSQWEAAWGPLVSIEEVHGQPYSRGWGVLVTCRFDLGVHTLSVFFDPLGKINGFGNSLAIAAANSCSSTLPRLSPPRAGRCAHRMLSSTMPRPSRSSRKPGPRSRRRLVPIKQDSRGLREGIGCAGRVVAFAHGKPTINVAVDLRGKVTGFHIAGNQEHRRQRPSHLSVRATLCSAWRSLRWLGASACQSARARTRRLGAPDGGMDAGDSGGPDAGRDAGSLLELNLDLHRLVGDGGSADTILAFVTVADATGLPVSGLDVAVDAGGVIVPAIEDAGFYLATVAPPFTSGELPVIALIAGTDLSASRTALVLPLIGDLWDQPAPVSGPREYSRDRRQLDRQPRWPVAHRRNLFADGHFLLRDWLWWLPDARW